MPDFKAKMHQIRFLPQTPLGELTALPRPPAGLRDPTSKGRGGEGEGGGKVGRGGEGKGGKGEEGRGKGEK